MVPDPTVTGDVPVEVNVTVELVAEFTETLPNTRLVVPTVRSGLSATPVPVRLTVVIPPPVELLLIASCPLTLPASAGLNCICRVID
jgi:hypothetical protein